VAWEPLLTRLNHTRLSRWKRSLRAIDFIPAASPRKIGSMLDGFKPDLVLNLMQNSDYYEAAERFCRTKKIPLLLIVHDTNEDFEPVFGWAQKPLFEKDRRIYRFAKGRFCVSPAMAEFNEKRFGVRSDVVYPIPDPELRPRPIPMSAELRQPPQFTIGYAGALAYGYGEMMLRLLPLFEKAEVRLELCSPKPAGAVSALLNSTIVKWHGYFPSLEAMKICQERCDAVLLPYLNPPGEYQRLYSTHFPSKLCDYLQLGMPIIVTGPSCATGVRWGRSNPDAVSVIECGDDSKHFDTIKRLCSSSEWRVQLATHSVAVGERDFNPIANRASFVAAIRTITSAE
jgi:glycosyltransferase involved in cell wall biosynthesis